MISATARMMVCLVIFLPPYITRAQITVTTDVDLQAAYCIELTRSDIKVQQEILAKYAPSDRGDDYQASKSQLTLAQANLRRLMLYELPRQPYLNVSAIMAAQLSAKEDAQRFWAQTGICFKECGDDMQCMMKCGSREMPDLFTFLDKRSACRELSWLPI